MAIFPLCLSNSLALTVKTRTTSSDLILNNENYLVEIKYNSGLWNLTKMATQCILDFFFCEIGTVDKDLPVNLLSFIPVRQRAFTIFFVYLKTCASYK